MATLVKAPKKSSVVLKEDVMETIKKTAAVGKHTAWQLFGAAFMEKKDGHQAVSLTRLLALLCFGYLSWEWLSGNEVPDTLLYTFWGLISGKTLESMTALWKGQKGA